MVSRLQGLGLFAASVAVVSAADSSSSAKVLETTTQIFSRSDTTITRTGYLTATESSDDPSSSTAETITVSQNGKTYTKTKTEGGSSPGSSSGEHTPANSTSGSSAASSSGSSSSVSNSKSSGAANGMLNTVPAGAMIFVAALSALL